MACSAACANLYLVIYLKLQTYICKKRRGGFYCIAHDILIPVQYTQRKKEIGTQELRSATETMNDPEAKPALLV